MAERDENGFLERWSRRKRGEGSPGAPEPETAEAAPEAANPAAAPAAAGRSQSEESPDSGDPEVIAKLPDLDSLTEETDFTAFLKDGVPEALRRQALRRLWRLNPVFANLDGLNDYDEDFSALGMVAENIKSIYKVGKGYLDEDEAETETEDKTEDVVAAKPDAETGGAVENETGDAEALAESGSHAAPDSEAPIPDDPVESTQISRAAPASDAVPPAAGDFETKPERPARGSALARRWGGAPDKAKA
jgi:hypothetical protein